MRQDRDDHGADHHPLAGLGLLGCPTLELALVAPPGELALAVLAACHVVLLLSPVIAVPGRV